MQKMLKQESFKDGNSNELHLGDEVLLKGKLIDYKLDNAIVEFSDGSIVTVSNTCVAKVASATPTA